MKLLPEQLRILSSEEPVNSPRLYGIQQIEAELEHLLSEPIDRIVGIDTRLKVVEEHAASIPEIKVMVTALSNSMNLMAVSAERMAEVFEKSEQRQEKNEDRYAGKESIPLRSHYWALAAAIIAISVGYLVIVILVLFLTKTDLNATLNSIQINQKKTQDLIQQSADDIEELHYDGLPSKRKDR